MGITSWEVEELQKLSQLQPELVDQALKDLWTRNPELYQAVVVNAYLDRRINLGKAAELLGITRIELQRELTKRGVPIRTLSREDAVAEVEAMKNWRKESSS